MWLLARNIAHSKVEDASTIEESLYSTIRSLLIVSAAFCLACVPFLTSDWSGPRILGLMIGILIVGLTFALANYLLKKDHLLGLMTWTVGIVLTLLTACWLMQKPSLILLSAVLPVIAVITIGGWAGLAAEGIVIVLVWIVSRAFFGGPLPLDPGDPDQWHGSIQRIAGLDSHARTTQGGAMVHVQF